MNEFILTAVGVVILVGCVMLILHYIDEPPPPQDAGRAGR